MKKLSNWFEGESSASFHRYFVMWLMAWICGLILTLCLFLRPTPYDMPYVMDLTKYLPHAIFYMSFGLAVIVFPFMLISLLIRWDEKRQTGKNVAQSSCAVLLGISLLYEHLDNEILRFCDMHITPDFLRTYVLSQGVPSALWDLLATDPGGSNVSLWLLGIPVIFLVCWFCFGKRIPAVKKIQCSHQWILLGMVFIGLVFLPFFLRTDLFGSKNRQAKVAPPIILIADTINTWSDGLHFPDNMPERLQTAKQEWLQTNHYPWRFVDEHNWIRHFDGNCPKPDKTYHVLIIVLESFRAKSLTLFNKSEKFEVTPWMNHFALSENAAYWTDYYTNGHPTVAAFMALHTGLLPHSIKTVAKAYTGNQLDSFVASIRKRGYQTSFFAGSDPDWDNQRPWLVRWYDEVLFNPQNDEADRNVMHDMAQWLKVDRDKTKPFLSMVFLISNHMPFHLREENLRVTDGDSLIEKIYNTMHYDDDVLREFFESIQDEPWYDDTLIVVTGDHGLDLGDRGQSPDYNNLRTEAAHVPLIIAGNHPRLPHGKQTQPGSHIDLGATILDLLGICDDTAAQGHSLLDLDPNRDVHVIKYGRASLFSKDWSAYTLEDDTVMLYHRNDELQLNDVSAEYPDQAKAMLQQMRDISIVNDYSYSHHLTDK